MSVSSLFNRKVISNPYPDGWPLPVVLVYMILARVILVSHYMYCYTVIDSLVQSSITIQVRQATADIVPVWGYSWGITLIAVNTNVVQWVGSISPAVNSTYTNY